MTTHRLRLQRAVNHQPHGSKSTLIHAFRTHVHILRHSLSRAKGLDEDEVLSRNRFNYDLIDPRCKSLELLGELPIPCKPQAHDTTLDSKDDPISWPDMLQVFRVTLFTGCHGKEIYGCANENPINLTAARPGFTIKRR